MAESARLQKHYREVVRPKLRAELARIPTRQLSAEAKAHVAEMISLLDEAQKAPVVRQAI